MKSSRSFEIQLKEVRELSWDSLKKKAKQLKR